MLENGRMAQLMDRFRHRGEGAVSFRKAYTNPKTGVTQKATWIASFLDKDGSGKRKYIYAPTQVEVIRKLREAQDQGARGELPVGRDQTVETFLTDWLAGKSVRPTTRRRYAQIVSHHLTQRWVGTSCGVCSRSTSRRCCGTVRTCRTEGAII